MIPVRGIAPRDALEKELNADGSGFFVQTSHGRTFASQFGSAGPILVMVHGYSISSVVFLDVARRFASRGFRVLTYDMYGRGLSDAADAQSTMSLYTSQLASLLLQLRSADATPDAKWRPVDGERVHVLGVSMGGAVSTGFVAAYPQLVRSLSLVAPAGMPVHRPLLARLATLPVLGDALMPVLGERTLLKHIDSAYVPPMDAEARAKADRQAHIIRVQSAHHPGFFRSLLSTLRYFPLSDAREHMAKAAASGVPIRVVWGDKDTVCLTENAEEHCRILGGAELQLVGNAGHAVLGTHTDEVVPGMVEFMRRAEGGGGEGEGVAAGGEGEGGGGDSGGAHAAE